MKHHIIVFTRILLAICLSIFQTKESNAAAINPAASIADSASIGSNLSLKEVQQLIDLHNKVRADVGVGPLIWSKELAIYARQWAEHLASEGCGMEHRPHSGRWRQEHGENLFMGTSGHYGVADAVTAWESEKRYYKGGTLNL